MKRVLSTTEARQGKEVRPMKWVLGLGMAGGVIVMLAAWLMFGG